MKVKDLVKVGDKVKLCPSRGIVDFFALVARIREQRDVTVITLVLKHNGTP